jgi:hypothetical protein
MIIINETDLLREGSRSRPKQRLAQVNAPKSLLFNFYSYLFYFKIK